MPAGLPPVASISAAQRLLQLTKALGVGGRAGADEDDAVHGIRAGVLHGQLLAPGGSVGGPLDGGAGAGNEVGRVEELGSVVIGHIAATHHDAAGEAGKESDVRWCFLPAACVDAPDSTAQRSTAQNSAVAARPAGQLTGSRA